MNRLNRCCWDETDLDGSPVVDRVNDPANGSPNSRRRDDDAIGIAALDGDSRYVFSGDEALLARPAS